MEWGNRAVKFGKVVGNKSSVIHSKEFGPYPCSLTESCV